MYILYFQQFLIQPVGQKVWPKNDVQKWTVTFNTLENYKTDIEDRSVRW